MRTGILAAAAVLLAGTGVALAQAPAVVPAPVGYGWEQAGYGMYSPVENVTPAPNYGGPANDVYEPILGPSGPRPAFHDAFWLDGEFLLWKVKDGPLPFPVATTGVVPPDLLPGAIGGPGTAVLIGNTQLDYSTFAGGRISGGLWLDPSYPVSGLDASGFFLGRRFKSLSANSDGNGNPAIAVPFTNASNGQNTVVALAFFSNGAPFFAGGVNLTSSSRLYGADGDIIGILYRGNTVRVTLLTGFRYLNLDEDLTLIGRKEVVAGGNGNLFFGGVSVSNDIPGIPNSVTTLDNFDARSQFYGGQAGCRVEIRKNRFFFEACQKAAMGVTHEEVNVFGFSRLQLANTAFYQGPTVLPGGILATAGNSGVFKDNDFSLMGETTLKLGVDIAYGLSSFLGFDFLYWGKVARPGEQINQRVDATQIPISTTFTPGFQSAPPTRDITTSTFLATGLSIGLEYRY